MRDWQVCKRKFTLDVSKAGKLPLFHYVQSPSSSSEARRHWRHCQWLHLLKANGDGCLQSWSLSLPTAKHASHLSAPPFLACPWPSAFCVSTILLSIQLKKKRFASSLGYQRPLSLVGTLPSALVLLPSLARAWMYPSMCVWCGCLNYPEVGFTNKTYLKIN